MSKFFTLLFTIGWLTSFGQGTISGKVTDRTGEPIPGVSVYIKDTYDGTTTDINGEYSFTTDEKGMQVLIFQSMGYKRHEVTIEIGKILGAIDVQLKEAINELSSVVIAAGAMEASDESKAVMLRPLDIVTTPSAMGDIVGALQTLPGTSTVGNDGRLFVRGGDASETAIFIDGMIVGNSFGSTAANVPTRTRFNANLFKGSFFSTGGYSAEYGHALSSALVLNTVDLPLRSQGDISLMSVGGGYTQTVALDNQSITASANYFDLSPYQSLINQNFDWERSPYGWDTEVSYRRKWGKAGMVKAYARTEGGGMKLWQPEPGTEGRGTLVDLTNRYTFGQASFRQEGQKGWFYYGGVSYSRNADMIQLELMEVHNQNEVLHGKLVAVKNFSEELSLKSGIEHYLFDYEERLPEQHLRRGIRDHQPVLFTEATYFVSNSLVFRGGGRAGYSSLSGQQWVDPRVSLAYKFKNEGQLSLAAGRFNQSPTENLRVAAPSLQNTEASHLILNYFLSKNGRTLRAEAFYKGYSHLVNFTGSAWGLDNITQNGEGFAQGFDVFFRDRKSIKNTDFWVTYSFVDSKRQFAYFTTQVQPSFAPRHNGSVVAKHFVRRLKSQLGASFSFNDGYTYADPNKAGDFPATINSRTKSYQDLSLSWSYLPRPNLIIHLACSNVLGRDNVFGYRYSTAPGLNGQFASLPVRQGAPRFLFLGVFLTLSKDKSANQLNNL